LIGGGGEPEKLTTCQGRTANLGRGLGIYNGRRGYEGKENQVLGFTRRDAARGGKRTDSGEKFVLLAAADISIAR